MDITTYLLSLPAKENTSSLNALIGQKNQCSEFNIPDDLRVGTLDSLMTVNKDLGRVEQVSMSLLRKLENQAMDLKSPQLLVQDRLPWDYLCNFEWEGRFSKRDKLPDLTKRLADRVQKNDDSFKKIAMSFREAETLLATIRRKKSGNLLVSDLKDVLTTDRVKKAAGVIPQVLFNESTFFKTVVVIVPSGIEKEFLNTYEFLDNQAVGLDDGTAISPVVPGSAIKIETSENDKDDGYLLYTVRILRGADDQFVENFKTACREKRFIVRTYTPAAIGSSDEMNTLALREADAESKVQSQRKELEERCATYYEDVFVAFAHIKAIRVFVESKLRYGLDDFNSFIFQVPNSNTLAKCKKALCRKYAHLDTSGVSSMVVSDKVANSLDSSKEEYLPVVFIPFV